MSQSNLAGRQNSIVRSGVLSDTRSFKWKIENFAVVRQSLELIKAQKFQFKIGESIGQPTTWSCYLDPFLVGNPNCEQQSISVYFQVLDKPNDVNKVNVSLDVSIKRTDDSGKDFLHETVPFKSMYSYYTCGTLIAKNEKQAKKVPLVEGSLVIDMDFTLYAPRHEPMVSLDLCGRLETFKTKSTEQLIKDLSETDTLTSPSANFVTKIFSKDGIEFPANRGILSARSPVFQRMFQTKMSEAITGEVRIDDISGKTLKALLGYIYTGTLHPDWNKSAEDIQELAYAARKYDLGLLTEFLEGQLLEEGQRECNTDRNEKKALTFWHRIWGRKRK